jgi:hypothetical protein
MPRATPRDAIYRGRRFSVDVIELCVRWYITSPGVYCRSAINPRAANVGAYCRRLRFRHLIALALCGATRTALQRTAPVRGGIAPFPASPSENP